MCLCRYIHSKPGHIAIGQGNICYTVKEMWVAVVQILGGLRPKGRGLRPKMLRSQCVKICPIKIICIIKKVAAEKRHRAGWRKRLAESCLENTSLCGCWRRNLINIKK